MSINKIKNNVKLNTCVAMNIRYYEEDSKNKCDQYVFGDTHFV